jgi:NAD(P)H-hydrate repair Nnr-like enzyme with NAD(P)H-hydrate dehydratase domain
MRRWRLPSRLNRIRHEEYSPAPAEWADCVKNSSRGAVRRTARKRSSIAVGRIVSTISAQRISTVRESAGRVARQARNRPLTAAAGAGDTLGGIVGVARALPMAACGLSRPD